MRAVWTIARILVALLALAMAFLTVLFVTGPGETRVEVSGAVIDAVALVILVVVARSLWRDRKSLL